MKEPLFRESFDAVSLFRDHPPRLHHPNKISLFEMAYPEGTLPAGTIEVTQWAQHIDDPLLLSPTLATEIRSGFFDYVASKSTMELDEWHVNFADPRLFAAYGSRLFAQDEMQVAEHPLLGSVREALIAMGLQAMTTDGPDATPVLVRNVERRIAVSTDPDAAAHRPEGLYGNRFESASFGTLRRAVRRIDPPTISHIVAMAAPSYGQGVYTRSQIVTIFGTAYTAFSAARHESLRACRADVRTVIHSGFWGCGAFGGNRTMMVAVQTLAARAAKIDILIMHAGDEAGVEDMAGGLAAAEKIGSLCGATSSIGAVADEMLKMGCRWGYSDGN